ncbi:MAG: DUF3464 family protein [Merismopedia sp. SIO2A8]|nr:DUF3464 family protein [Symploca sp. SIO2B6]NET49410.1 DUF3464 family protein [Merismopedia sp. SIO2A8]
MASKSKSKASDRSKDELDKASPKAGSDRLPFEPASNKKKNKSEKSQSEKNKSEKVASSPAVRATASTKANRRDTKPSRQDSTIPEEISQRMIKRMAVLCGVPTALGLLTFVISYFIVAKGGIDLPPIAVLLVSLGFFGLGVLGLSYGALSTSWELGSEPGSLVGWPEFKVNIGRMQQAWKEAREQSQS